MGDHVAKKVGPHDEVHTVSNLCTSLVLERCVSDQPPKKVETKSKCTATILVFKEAAPVAFEVWNITLYGILFAIVRLLRIYRSILF